MTQQKPLFISHGSPMMAVEKSQTSRFLQQLGQAIPTPSAIVVFSAHFDVKHDVIITAGQQKLFTIFIIFQMSFTKSATLHPGHQNLPNVLPHCLPTPISMPS